MIVLGLNAFHGDAAAALVRDGRMIAAAEEERFRRIKHWAGFPSQAIAYCLREAGLRLGDIDCIAINQDSRAHRLRRFAYAAGHPPSLGLISERLRIRRRRESIPELLATEFPGERFRGRIEHVEHHLAHLSSAFHISPFDAAVVLSLDGFGDFASAAWGIGRGRHIEITGQVHFPHSLGIFYQALTQYLGFPSYGDEYKVMGLAAYGTPNRLAAMRRIVRPAEDGGFALDLTYFRHHREHIAFSWEAGEPRFADLFSPALEELLGPRRSAGEPLEQRHRDIARSAQARYEEALFALLDGLHKRFRLTDLALAGGCAMNSVANGKLRRMTRFGRLYVQAAAGDAGGALGAAYAAWHRAGGPRGFVMDHAFWGPQFDDDAVAAALAEEQPALAAAGCRIETLSESDLCRRTAAALADGLVVGWFHGRMEWGPRALGNRSILCDPRRADVRAVLNAKIKRRESFRPFAPAVLEEEVGEWFEEDAAVPFMTEVRDVHADKRGLIPAVTHVDGSARVQTVSRHANARFHRLIEAFRERTGVPMVLNTSFNENEPVVCRPSEAIDCFLRTEMDMLAIGRFMLSRQTGATG